MILSILIPTFNRVEFLKKNIDFFESLNFNANEIEILVSDNHSTDGTIEYLKTISNSYIKVHFQKKNIGALDNGLFLLNSSNANYIMFLGDDDYLDDKYLDEIIPFLRSNKFSCIFPSRLSLFKDGSLKPSMDYNKTSREYNKGWISALINSQRATQLSGVVQLREGLYDSYIDDEISNLYPFIYYTIYNCLRGEVYLLTKFPVKITQLEQGEEVLDYGELNLLDHVFDNFHKFKSLSYFKKTLFECFFLFKQPYRYLSILKNKGIISFFSFISHFYSLKKLTSLTKLLFPIIFITVFVKKGTLIILRK